MNKDVVYIEPEDDITDIIARVKGAKQKLVALVPPKKIGVLRSAVNTKLIAKAARSAEKVVVIVTTDPSLIKLAAAAQIPVAKTLQSRPKLPSEIIEEEKDSGEQVIDENDFDDEDVNAAAASSGAASKNNKNATLSATAGSAPKNAAASKETTSRKPVQEITSDELENGNEKSKKDNNKKGIPVLEKYRKWIIVGASAFVLLIVFLVWAFGFAPAADIAVAIRTTTNNFSENVSFVTKTTSADPEKGIFLLEQQKVQKTNSVEFNATGEKNVGEKASGTLKLVATFTVATMSDIISVPAGTVFSHGDYGYATASTISFSLDGVEDDCTTSQLKNGTCTVSAETKVSATEAGEKYNIGAYGADGWSSPIANVAASNASAFSGGTDKTVTVVSQSDFDTAKEKLSSEGREDGRAELIKLFGDDMVVIDSSLEVSTSDPKSTPAINEEVKSGEKPKIEATTTYTMYAVDKTALENYIKAKSEGSVAADQKIYAVDTPFFENFQKDNNDFTAKLKSSTQTGPKVTEEDIMEKAKGRKVGEVQSLLKSINGVSSVKINTSFPWVNTVPDDPNKITIELKVEE